MILVGSILVMGITFYMAGIYGSTSLALLGYIELTFVILANLYAHVTGFFVKVDFSIPVGVAEIRYPYVWKATLSLGCPWAR